MLHPHIPEDLKHFGKHLFATFLGLLMALGLEQWREHHHEVKLAKQALATVEAELREDVVRLQRQKSRCEESLRSTQALNDYLEQLIAAKREGRPLPSLPKLGDMGMALNFSTDAWETFKGLGALRQIAPDRARRLSRAYLGLAWIGQHFESHPILRQIRATFFLQMEQPEKFRNLDVAQLERAREGAQLTGAVFRWAHNEMAVIQDGCEAALKP